MKNLPISNEDLIATLKTRLETKRLVAVDECVVYQEYLDECSALIKQVIKIINVDHVYVVDSLRSISKHCSKIEAPQGKKVKRIPIFNNIMSDMRFIISDKEYERITPNSFTKGETTTINSLVHQAKGYCSNAFDWDTFDDASTKLLDASDVLELAQDIYKGDMEAAAKHCDFDTCVRESISNRAWEWILNNVK